MRGNLAQGGETDTTAGSIPACAGEPTDCALCFFQQRVYPRVCGGTGLQVRQEALRTGLSPRVRGNPLACHVLFPRARSIPACAGEPGCATSGIFCATVYPRVCGGTCCPMRAACGADGLSPRVRGNPRTVPTPTSTWRSIPACAGEPASSTGMSFAARVYPRVCGGTYRFRWPDVPHGGLSPRVRGNRIRIAQGLGGGRSIPACAGEPRHRRRAHGARQVYPRVCGGTGRRLADRAAVRGLSPRVRGNHAPRGGSPRVWGSIPACAGEPAQMYTLLMAAGWSLRVQGDFITGREGKSGLSKNYASWKVPGRRDRITPSWSTSSTGGSPMTRTV